MWLVVVLLVVLVLGLIRKVAALEAVAAGDRREPGAERVGGPSLGSPAPSLTAHPELTTMPATRHGRVLLFLNSSCSACRRLADELRMHDRAVFTSGLDVGGVELVLVTDRDGRAAFAGLNVDVIVVQAGGELSCAWSVPGTPFAVAVDHDGIVRASAFTNTATRLGELSRALRTSIDATAVA